MRGLIGKKMGMTRVFDENGNVVPVTVLQAGPCTVTQVKTSEKDGYEAVQVGFCKRNVKHTSKPFRGILIMLVSNLKKIWLNLIRCQVLTIKRDRFFT